MRIKGNISALAGLLLLGAGVAADDPVKVPYCGAHNATSHDLYDLSSLIRQKGSENYKIFAVGDPSLKEKNHTFQFNVCEPLTSIPKGIKVGQNVAITLLGDDGNEISLGKNSSTPILREGGLTLIYRDGDECTVDKAPTFFGDFNGCDYNFEWKTPAACPMSDTSLSAGSILFRFFCIAVFFYLLIGILYNRFVRNAQGLEQIPHFDFWFGIYDFVKDMTVIIGVKIWDTLSSCRSRPSQYNSVPRSDMNALTIDDDDDDDEL